MKLSSKIDWTTLDSLTTICKLSSSSTSYEIQASGTNIVSDDVSITVDKSGTYLVEFTGQFLSRISGGSSITLYIVKNSELIGSSMDLSSVDNAHPAQFTDRALVALEQGDIVRWGYWQNTGDTSRLTRGRTISILKVA